jgi:hypothetical protein
MYNLVQKSIFSSRFNTLRVFKVLLLTACFSGACWAQNYACLPADIHADDIVSIKTTTTRSGGTRVERTTVVQKLRSLGARCVRSKLRDNSGREIRFFRLNGCWGNPPADYLEILSQQRKEIDRLKRSFTVIEMTCNRSGGPPQSIS